MLERNSAAGVGAEDEAWSVAHNDTLIPAEYQDQRQRSQLDPEKRLMLAILRDAVACYRRNAGTQLGKRRRLFLEVETWIEDHRSDCLFSFRNICDTLGIDPDYLTRGLFHAWDPHVERPEIGQLRLDASSRRRTGRKRRKRRRLGG